MPAGGADEAVRGGWPGLQDAVLGVVVEVLGGVEIGAVAGQVDDFEQVGSGVDERACLLPAMAGVAVDDEDQLVAVSSLEEAAQEVDEDVLAEAAVEDPKPQLAAVADGLDDVAAEAAARLADDRRLAPGAVGAAAGVV